MKQKIDNERMWGFLFNALKEWESPITRTDIDNALYDQGLQYNPETKEIESIEQPSEHKLVEAVVNEPMEQKPKFKVGDWIVYRENIWKVGNIALENYYELLKTNNEVATRSIKEVDENAHIWTIQDAKDGDVLYYNNLLNHGSGIMIYMKDKSSECVINKYCSCNEFGFEIESYIVLNDGFVSPATKEQRDTLFKAMHDAGYIFLSGKKKLVKLLFKEGNTVRKKFDGSIWHINYINENGYWGNHKPLFPIENQNEFELVEPELTHSEVTKESDQKLTEFEEEFLAIVDSWCHGDGRVYKDCNEQALKDAKLLISIAHKQFSHKEVTSDQELTEFESKLRFIIDNNPSGVNFKVLSRELLSIARKQFIKEACEYIHLHIGELNDLYIRTALREEFINDFRKALEKGE